MMSLFDAVEERHLRRAQPLAARMRPRSLEEFVGQRHFLGEGRLLWRLLRADRLGSVIFYGPPGTGKTTLALLLAQETQAHYRELSAVTSGVKELRSLLSEARDELAASGRRTLLFVDEIHRFNRAQQDVLLHDVEDGVVILVGATTANPFFAVNAALVSRSQVFQFEPLSPEEIKQLLSAALRDPQRGLGKRDILVDDDALDFLAAVCDGDARRALSALEVAVLSATTQPVRLDRNLAVESVQRKPLAYDSQGDLHYDCASALIKSIRGSDPDAAVYWLARMLSGGEDVRFLCRRLVILASEDVGNADPHALPLAVAALHACEFVGLPECQLTLAQVVTYLACAPKSNAATLAISAALDDVQQDRVQPVPRHLRDRNYPGAGRLDHGTDYQYAHDDPDGIVTQPYLGIARQYYHPVPRGYERELAERLEQIRRRLTGATPAADQPPAAK